MIDIYGKSKVNKSDAEIIFDEYVPLTITFSQTSNFKKYIRLENDDDFIELGIDNQSNQLVEFTIVSLKTVETITKDFPTMLSSSCYKSPVIEYPDDDKNYVIYDIPFTVGLYQDCLVITFDSKIHCSSEGLRVTKDLFFSCSPDNKNVRLILTSISADKLEKLCLAIV